MSDKRNADIKKLENWLTRANELKADLEDKVNKMTVCIDKIREKHPDAPPAKDINTFEPYIKLNEYISIVTKIIEKRKNDNK